MSFAGSWVPCHLLWEVTVTGSVVGVEDELVEGTSDCSYVLEKIVEVEVAALASSAGISRVLGVTHISLLVFRVLRLIAMPQDQVGDDLVFCELLRNSALALADHCNGAHSCKL